MSTPEIFSFNNTSYQPSFDDALIGFVPEHVSNVADLMQSIADALSFPAYFGRNWNALCDCLRDFHWTDKKNIVLIHNDLPVLANDDFRIYIGILRDAIIDWKSDESHNFYVIFNKSAERTVTNALE
jgi:RNAse (barnase) inhibitor barstar